MLIAGIEHELVTVVLQKEVYQGNGTVHVVPMPLVSLVDNIVACSTRNSGESRQIDARTLTNL